MASYQIYRLREQLRQQFRLAPHMAGLTTLKEKDYEPSGMVEAASPYAAWEQLRKTERQLQVGDVLESPEGNLCICKYVGFEEARWFVPEPAAATAGENVTPL